MSMPVLRSLRALRWMETRPRAYIGLSMYGSLYTLLVLPEVNFSFHI